MLKQEKWSRTKKLLSGALDIRAIFVVRLEGLQFFKVPEDYKSDIMPLTSSAKNSPQGPVSRDILLNRLDSVTAFAFFSVLLQPSITGSDFT
ncbi:hypothetical protein Y1Q_0020443 [Alligator mississippiensis]|uniref:Uncharacterized protein n=1 Tax=Alligator mississippiensis TaxID=8496 RepID=A0A151N7E8_ALLMI|nr:hypothetical protein Y1Q_0020443 [Alligator mississippiensis]